MEEEIKEEITDELVQCLIFYVFYIFGLGMYLLYDKLTTGYNWLTYWKWVSLFTIVYWLAVPIAMFLYHRFFDKEEWIP